ncbi:MAG TPA: hypothetical protein VJL88_12085 [Nitrospira sp.]|nr:hypothetical protein [Nitrospira sp.]
MPNLHVVSDDVLPEVTSRPAVVPVKLMVQWCIGILAAFALGTWLVWWAALVQRSFTLEDIRSACQRVMPEAVERCIDTVTIQRGGARR